MKKLFSLLALLLLTVTTAWAGEKFTYELNGGTAVSTPNNFFSHEGGFTFNTKFKDCEYEGKSYSNGLKMESSSKILFTTDQAATVTIVQSNWSDKKVKLDGTEITERTNGTGCYIYTVKDVAAGNHNITRGGGELGLFLVKVEYASKATFINDASWNDVYVWAWNDAGENFTGGEWPGVKLTAGDDGKYPWKTMGDPTKILFNDGGNNQTPDFDFKNGGVYDSQKRIITINNYSATFKTDGMDEAYAYAWNGDDKPLGAWPGTKMEGGNGEFTIAIEAEDAPKYIIFHDNNGNQTPDLPFEDKKVYEYMLQDFSVSFNTDAEWNDVYVYMWTGDKVYTDAWPGTKMVGEAYEFKAFVAPDYIQFNNGEAKTGDLKFVNNKAYEWITAEPLYKLNEGDSFTAGQTVEVKDADKDVVATITYGSTGNAFTAAVAANVGTWAAYGAMTAGNGTNGDSDGGTAYTITPKYDGTVTVAVRLNGGKKFYIKEGDTALPEFNGITIPDAENTTYTFDVTAEKSYKIYCAGSKLGFFGFDYKFNKPEPQLNTYTATFTTNAGWNEVRAYAWSGTEGQEGFKKFLGDWPGSVLEATEGVYTVTIKAEAAPDSIIFNNGAGEQTADLAFEDGKAYNYQLFTVSVAEDIQGGSIGVNPEKCVAGTAVEVYVKPGEDLVLDELYYIGATTQRRADIVDETFFMPEEDVVVYATFKEAPQPEVLGYYVVGNMTEWTYADGYLLEQDPTAATGYFTLTKEFKANDEFKVLSKMSEGDGTWYPDGMGNNWTVTQDGEYTITFDPNGNQEWQNGFFNVVMKEEPIVVNEYTVQFVNGAKWEQVYAYTWTGKDPDKVEQLGAWAGTEMGLIDTEAEIDGKKYPVYELKFSAAVEPDSIVFSNGRGGEAGVTQTANLEFVNEYQYALVLDDEPVNPDQQEEEIEFTAAGTGTNPMVYTKDHFTYTFDKGSGSTNPAYVTSAEETRLYAKGTLTIKANASEKIIAINFDAKLNENKSGIAPTIDGVAGKTTAGTWNAEDWSWTGEDTEVTMTTSGTAGNVGFKGITVTYTDEGGGGDQPVEIKTMAIVGDFLGLEATGESNDPNWDPANGWEMTQSTDNPAIWTYVKEGFVAEAKKYEYKAAANGNWEDYVLPEKGNQDFVFGTDMYPAGTYNLTFTANTSTHELTLDVAKDGISTVKELNAQANGTEFKFLGDAIVVATPAKGQSRYVYIKDATGNSLIFDKSGELTADIAVGNVITAPWEGTVSIYKSLFEAVPTAALGATSTVQVVIPEGYPEDVVADSVNKVMEIKGLSIDNVDGQNIKFTIGNAAVVGYNQFGIELPADYEGKTFDVVGAVGRYNDNIQFQPITITEVVEPEPQAFAASFTTDKKWDKVFAYIWKGGIEAPNPWPGVEITETKDGDTYNYAFQSTYAPDFIIFNDGTKEGSVVGTNQTADLPFVDGMIYSLTTEKTTAWAGDPDEAIPATTGIIIPAKACEEAGVQAEKIIRIVAKEIAVAAPARGLDNAVAELAAGDISIYKGSDPTVKLVPDDEIKAIPEGYEFVADEAIANEMKAGGFIIKSNVPETKQIAITEIEIEKAPAAVVNIDFAPAPTDDIGAVIEARAAEITAAGNKVGNITITLGAIGTPYTTTKAIVAPAGVLIQGAGAATSIIDASGLEGDLITLNGTEALAQKKDGTDSDHKLIASVEVNNLKIAGLKGALITDAQKTLLEKLTINNAVVEMPAAAKNVINFNGKGYVGEVVVNNSTIYANGMNTGFFAQYGSRPKNVNEDWFQTFDVQNSTFVNIANTKNFTNLKQNGTDHNKYILKNNIFVDCGKTNQVVVGFNNGQTSATPIWDVDNNVFNASGADGSAAEVEKAGKKGEEDIVKNSIAGVVTFTDAATGDFNGTFALGEGASEPATKPGDPRWTITYATPVVITTMSIVGEFTGGWPVQDPETSAWDWSMAKAMTQDAENANIWTLEMPFVAEAKKYEYKAAANSNWNDYVLPAGDNANFEFGTPEYPAGEYILTFTADTKNHTVGVVAKWNGPENIEISPESGDIAAALATAVEGKNVGNITINLKADGEYTIGSAMVAPGAFTVRGNGATVNVAAEFTGEAIVKMAASAEAPTAVTKVDYISFHDVTFKGLSKALFYSTQKKYDIEWFTIENCVLELTADATTIDFTKGSAARNINVVNSTIYAPTATTKSFYSSQGGEKMTEIDADGIQTFIFKNNTMYNLAPTKNFFTHRQANQKWLAYDVENNIFVNCGKSGQVIKGMNGGQGGANPTWTIIGNAFNFDGADTSAAESTGDTDHTGDETPGLNETVQNSVAGVVTFTDAANGDFNGDFKLAPEATAPAALGAPKWILNFVETIVVDKLYIMGNGTAGEWSSATEMTFNETTQAFEYDITASGDTYFTFGDAAFTDWADWNANHRYAIAAGDQPAEMNATYELVKVEGTVKVTYTGKLHVSVTKDLKMTLTPATGINGIVTDDADDNAPIYNLAGQKVGKNYKGVVIKNGKKVYQK